MSSTLSRQPPRILVVGAGPSGLVMALALLRNGVPVRLIDKETTSRLGQRGAGIMPRSLELFHALGVGDEILRRAIPPPQAVMYAMPGGVEVISKFDMWPPAAPTPQRPFPNVVMLGQDHLEQILRTALQRLGCEPEWGSTLLAIEQCAGEDVVRTRISRPARDGGAGEVEEVEAEFDYVLGTDGARGMVRKALGLTFLGETNNADNLVVGDVMVHGLDRNLWHMWGQVGAAWISLRPTEVPFMCNFLLSGSDIDHAYIVEHPEALASIFVQYTGGRRDLVFGDVVWLSHYRPNIRMVDKFGVGRVFVAGDAAHVHSITGGQGMNTGIQDAFNLAWKLALVQRKLAPETLLSTYTEERAPVVATMLNQITALLKESWAGKNGDPPPVRESSSAWRHNGGLLQLGVNCRWSSVVVDEQRQDALLEDIEPDYYDGDGDDDDDDDASDAYVVDRPLAAGDRAPDAPGLIVLKRRVPARNAAADARTTSLFNVFLASSHTVLILSNNASRYAPVLRLLDAYPKDVVHSAVVVRAGAPADVAADADLVLEDGGGHAYGAYALRDGCDIVVVRPDGLVGAVVRSREGLRRYFRGVFGQQTK
ncbi:FAD binding domain-containing protein [Mycena epipterygia]|nr:FAD binding domain-containing protein [Mycena epipterygia]